MTTKNTSEHCSYHPDVELTDEHDGDTPTPCAQCWNEYQYPAVEPVTLLDTWRRWNDNLS